MDKLRNLQIESYEAAFEANLQRRFKVGHVFPCLFGSKTVRIYKVLALFLPFSFEIYTRI